MKNKTGNNRQILLLDSVTFGTVCKTNSMFPNFLWILSIVTIFVAIPPMSLCRSTETKNLKEDKSSGQISEKEQMVSESKSKILESNDEDNNKTVASILMRQTRLNLESESSEDVNETSKKAEVKNEDTQNRRKKEIKKLQEVTSNVIKPSEIASGKNAIPKTSQNIIDQTTENKQQLVTNMFYDTPIRQALVDIAAQTGVIILPDMSVQGIVTCELQDIPLEQALEIILSSGNFVFKQMNGFILVGSADSESPSFSRLSETYRMKMNYLSADEAVKILAEPIQEFVNANVADNSVSIFAPRLLLDRIISDLKMIDVPSRHVILDACIVAMEQGDLLNMGLQWNWPSVSAGTFSDSEHHGGQRAPATRWPWGIQIGYTPGKEFTNSLLLTLNLLTQNDEATVIASPRVLAQDGKEAEIKVVTQEYFKISQEAYYYTRFELETIETGTTLAITPRIGDNNEITLEIVTEVSDVISRGEDNLPVVTRRSTKNTVRIEDGGTAAIAGLMDSRKRVQDSETPGLAKIPIIGLLFKNTKRTESSRQVAVFVTARLMSGIENLDDISFVDRTPVKPVGEEFKIVLQEVISILDKGE